MLGILNRITYHLVTIQPWNKYRQKLGFVGIKMMKIEIKVIYLFIYESVKLVGLQRRTFGCNWYLDGYME